MMNTKARLILAVVAAIAVGCGKMAYDKWTDAEWVVSPRQIEAARQQGQAGVTTRPGSVAVRGIRSETADILPLTWAIYGIVAGLAVFFVTRQRKA